MGFEVVRKGTIPRDGILSGIHCIDQEFLCFPGSTTTVLLYCAIDRWNSQTGGGVEMMGSWIM